jgi:hypothetical protein
MPRRILSIPRLVCSLVTMTSQDVLGVGSAKAEILLHILVLQSVLIPRYCR